MYTDHSNAQNTGVQIGAREEPPQEGAALRGDAAGVERDAKGRFTGSGNKLGRPKSKKLPEPTSLGAALARELEEPVTVKVAGVTKQVPAFTALAKKMIASGLGGGSMDLMRLLRLLILSGALNAAQDVIDHREQLAAQTAGPVWTDELEAQFQALEGMYEDPEDPPFDDPTDATERRERIDPDELPKPDPQA